MKLTVIAAALALALSSPIYAQEAHDCGKMPSLDYLLDVTFKDANAKARYIDSVDLNGQNLDQIVILEAYGKVQMLPVLKGCVLGPAAILDLAKPYAPA